MNDNALGARIKALRKERGFTQDELAQLVGVTRSAINETERSTSKIRMDTAAKMHECLDVSLYWLCGIDNNPENTLINFIADLLRLDEIEFERIPQEIRIKYAETMYRYALYPKREEMKRYIANMKIIVGDITYAFGSKNVNYKRLAQWTVDYANHGIDKLKSDMYCKDIDEHDIAALESLRKQAERIINFKEIIDS